MPCIAMYAIIAMYYDIYHIISRYIKSWYITLFCVVLCCVALCCTVLRYVTLRYITLRYITSHHIIILCYVMLCYVMLCYVMLCYVTSCHVTSHHINIISYHILTYHIIRCGMAWNSIIKIFNFTVLSITVIQNCLGFVKYMTYIMSCNIILSYIRLHHIMWYHIVYDMVQLVLLHIKLWFIQYRKLSFKWHLHISAANNYAPTHLSKLSQKGYHWQIQ